MTGTWLAGTLRTSAAGACCLALGLGACGPSDDADASTDEAATDGTGGSSSYSDELIQGLSAALGNSAIALQSAEDTAFWPPAATDENDDWLVEILGAYDAALDDGVATGLYRATQPTEASLDFELEAAISAAPYRAFVGPSWLNIALREEGASGFRVDVTCTDVEVNATGSASAVLIVGQDTGDTTSGSLFCVAAAGQSSVPFSQPSASFEVEADEEGYAVMEYFEVTAVAGTFDEGDTASVKAKVHLEFTALE
jgi:hypothetical protein